LCLNSLLLCFYVFLLGQLTCFRNVLH
jgi:hypothetical protein